MKGRVNVLLQAACFSMLHCSVFSQIHVPQAPSFGTFQPVSPQPSTMQRYDNNYGNIPMPNASGQVQMGATADDILRQANRNNPSYGYGNDPASMQRANEAWIHAQMANDPAYNPSLRNGVRNPYALSKQQQLFNLIHDAANADNNRKAIRDGKANGLPSQAFATQAKSYADALEALKEMLIGKRKLSLADAYFIMENAYGEAYLTQQEFKSTLRESADFLKRWMQQHHLNGKDNAVINYAVQKFMGEHLTIAITEKTKDGKQSFQTIDHQPFFYDFGDFTGDKDHRNFFLTKCLATGSGQCNSMPAVYLSLVEALGGKAYLATAPQHSLVKYPDNEGNMRNYEPTSHWDITNEWYQDNMFISAQAARNNIYLAPMNEKQIVADIALQLAFGYFRKFGGTDKRFITDCIETAKPYFPKHNNLAVYFEYSNLYGYELMQAMRKNGINRLSDISRSPEAQQAYQKWQQNEEIISSLGYQDQPKDMYEEMMKYHEFRGTLQDARHVNGKVKRNLFIKTTQARL